MSTEPGAISWRLQVHESLPSTSDLIAKLATAGEPEGLAVLAREQTAGRGSRGRGWQSPAGNLYLSVLLRPLGPIADAGHWALLAGVALVEVLSGFMPDDASTALTLKWPNDVLLRGRKLAGILMDSATRPGGQLDWLIVGMGVNLATAPSVPGRATACLGELTLPPPPERVAEMLLARLDYWVGVARGDGFGPVDSAWIARAHPVGSVLRLTHDGVAIDGSFAGLGEDGSLLLATAGKVQAFSTGEVLLGLADQQSSSAGTDAPQGVQH
jgi:BirA family biotin operon repressor/biotin-[acetyl-CoA-carboxylase] ligase